MATTKRKSKPRTFETKLSACAHTVTVRWWDIVGPVTDEQLEDAAEDHAREYIAKDYHSGELNYEDDESSAHGWWTVREDS